MAPAAAAAASTSAAAETSSSSSSSSSSSWPSFAEMASSVMPNGVDGGGVGVGGEAEDAESYVGDEDIMDYQWNEDNIDIDFITGNERNRKEEQK